MGKLAPWLRGLIVAVAIVAVVGIYIGFKAYHQMHTPLPLIVIHEGRYVRDVRDHTAE